MDRQTIATSAERLDGTIAALRSARMAAQVFDADGRLVWVSDELRTLVDVSRDSDVALGRRGAEIMEHPVWRASLSDESIEAVREELTRRFDPSSDREAVWAAPLKLHLSGRFLSVGLFGVTVRAEDGTVVGTALIYEPALPARVLALLAEGDEAMFARMARLTRPGPRPTAVLFADLDSSGPLARSLTNAAYFELIRGMTTAFDDLVNRYGGIIGKHAGDGASAFFLAETSGGDCAAAEAAVATARALPEALAGHLQVMAAADLDVAAEDARLNIGVHWGEQVFIGQVSTGGRLEVTAIGDEVNEAARLEQTARGGQILASRALLDRLDEAARHRLGLDLVQRPDRPLAAYDCSMKARRDAGTLPVVDLSRSTPEVVRGRGI